MTGKRQQSLYSSPPPPPPGTNIPPGADLPRRECVTLIRLRTGVGRFGANMYRWGFSPSAACLCGAPEQTADHPVRMHQARTTSGIPHSPDQPMPNNRGMVAASR